MMVAHHVGPSWLEEAEELQHAWEAVLIQDSQKGWSDDLLPWISIWNLTDKNKPSPLDRNLLLNLLFTSVGDSPAHMSALLLASTVLHFFFVSMF